MVLRPWRTKAHKLHPARTVLLLLALTTFATGQSAPPTPVPGQDRQAPSEGSLSPAAALDAAMHPLNVTRHNVANWSEIELAAMRVAIAQGRDACLARPAETYSGAVLLDLAHLCALGQQWRPVATAAGRYISEKTAPKPLLTDAYATRIDAELHLRDEPAALADALALLAAVPYAPDVADSIDETLDYLRFVYTRDALRLAGARQPLLLAALRKASGSAAPLATGTAAASPAPFGGSHPSDPTQPTVPVHQLFEEGLQLAALQQLAAQPEAAAETVEQTRKELPSALPPDEALPIAAALRGYALLGRPLPALEPRAWLQKAGHKPPPLPALRTITGLLLFPDTCAECRRLGPQLPETVFAVEGHSAYVYGLLLETVPPRTPPKNADVGADVTFAPAFAAAALAGTATIAVEAGTLPEVPSDIYPLLLLTDARGIVRVVQPVGIEALSEGGAVYSAIHRVGENFPLTVPSPSSEKQVHVPAPPGF